MKTRQKLNCCMGQNIFIEYIIEIFDKYRKQDGSLDKDIEWLYGKKYIY